jgi:hypothetical protein
MTPMVWHQGIHDAKIRLARFPWREPGMNTFSENGNDFVGRLLHEGGVSRRTFTEDTGYLPN